MKRGLLIYQSVNDIFNIGDYIQSLAARQFLSTPIEYITREKLSEYNKEPVKLIINGWFLPECNHWPPSEKIDPLFVAFHLNSYAYNILEFEKAIEYFKKHEPIGCRDKKTMELLKAKGIKVYFSGCLTLTLGLKYKFYGTRNSKIYFVDPFFEVKNEFRDILLYCKELILHFKVIKVIAKNLYRNPFLKEYIKATAFFIAYRQIFDNEVLTNAEYISHTVRDSDFKTEEDKFLYAEKLLEIYSKAHMVVTSRIHCALPCLALETPVLYIENLNQIVASSCRLAGLIDLLNVVSFNHGIMNIEMDIPECKIGFHIKFHNKENYEILKNDLILTCINFTSSLNN